MTLEVSLADQFSDIRDQGRRPTCVAFAASDLHTFVRANREPLSVEYAYYFAVRRSATSNPRSGVTLEDIRTAVAYDGQPVERDWPYLPVLPTDLSTWKPPSSVRAVYRHTSGAPASLPPSDIVELIKQRRAPLLVIALTTVFFTPDSSGVISETSAEPAIGTHAVLGIGCAQSNGEQFVLIRNSWGVGWGKKGTAWLSTEYLQHRLLAVMLMERP
jgi:hypothetical protein